MSKVNTCVYIERGILETAKELGLNVSKVAENSLAACARELPAEDAHLAASRVSLRSSSGTGSSVKNCTLRLFLTSSENSILSHDFTPVG